MGVNMVSSDLDVKGLRDAMRTIGGGLEVIEDEMVLERVGSVASRYSDQPPL
jgi:hypothetical protein